MTPLPAGITLRLPGTRVVEPWEHEEGRRLVLQAIAAEGRNGRPIPRALEVELNAAVTRQDMPAVRAWAGRIERAVEKMA